MVGVLNEMIRTSIIKVVTVELRRGGGEVKELTMWISVESAF